MLNFVALKMKMSCECIFYRGRNILSTLFLSFYLSFYVRFFFIKIYGCFSEQVARTCLKTDSVECGWIQMFIDSSIRNQRNTIKSALNNLRLRVVLMTSIANKSRLGAKCTTICFLFLSCVVRSLVIWEWNIYTVKNFKWNISYV